MQHINYYPTPLNPSPGPSLHGLPSLLSTIIGSQFLTISLQWSGPLRKNRLAPPYWHGSNSYSHSVDLINLGRELGKYLDAFQVLVSDKVKELTDMCMNMTCKCKGFYTFVHFSMLDHPLFHIYSARPKICSLQLHHDVAYIHTCSRYTVSFQQTLNQGFTQRFEPKSF